MQDILFGILIVLLLVGLLAFEYWCIGFRDPAPWAVVIDTNFYQSDDPRLGHPFGTYAPLIFDRLGKVFLADGADIVPLDKRELQKRLTADELDVVKEKSRSAKKICVVRNHDLTPNMKEWLVKQRYYWPGAGRCTSGSGKDDIIVSPL
jgi:hypothetical protein